MGVEMGIAEAKVLVVQRDAGGKRQARGEKRAASGEQSPEAEIRSSPGWGVAEATATPTAPAPTSVDNKPTYPLFPFPVASRTLGTCGR
ncbi:uncharacterized protein SETTUDRAFT_162118 [Exserohilum turcica Et28A]|uniref:Uncharacterized protein n=1 Tax=Exserohilum turcicum (strain 28A) TaxID=671987 RepID=R0KUC6_EXST2|nr:uncharacterized protein SETTUDRAFT_162118 [Exserohilum turcica Et28A]EOA91402.1 hypothetical protein SETTUDRAFT_162118 [Exserohilum turcica Et28A]